MWKCESVVVTALLFTIRDESETVAVLKMGLCTTCWNSVDRLKILCANIHSKDVAVASEKVRSYIAPIKARHCGTKQVSVSGCRFIVTALRLSFVHSFMYSFVHSFCISPLLRWTALRLSFVQSFLIFPLLHCIVCHFSSDFGEKPLSFM